jgi:hypothetical protein
LRKFEWQSVSGEELEDAVTRRSTVADLIDPCEAIYVWRRQIAVPPFAMQGPANFNKWVDQVVETHFGVVGRKELTHYLTLERLTVGGGGLTGDKVETLRQWTSGEKGRRFVGKFISSMNAFVPPLYVGETGDITVRAKQHVRFETLFGELLRDELGLQWRDVSLYYYCLGPSRDDEADEQSRKSRRTLLEMIASRIMLAGCVTRVG